MIDENHYFYARIGSGRKRHVVRTGIGATAAIDCETRDPDLRKMIEEVSK